MPSSCMSYSVLRCTGFKPSLTSGSARAYALRFLDGDVDTSSRQWKGSVRDLFTELGIKPEVIDSYYKAIHE